MARELTQFIWAAAVLVPELMPRMRQEKRWWKPSVTPISMAAGCMSTVNTLFKEKELDELCDYMKPYYEAGLDGVIVQDLGSFAGNETGISGMELHASTQMTTLPVYTVQNVKGNGLLPCGSGQRTVIGKKFPVFTEKLEWTLRPLFMELCATAIPVSALMSSPY